MQQQQQQQEQHAAVAGETAAGFTVFAVLAPRAGEEDEFAVSQEFVVVVKGE